MTRHLNHRYLFRSEYVMPPHELAQMQRARRDHNMLDHELHTLIARAEKYEHAGRTADADAVHAKAAKIDAKVGRRALVSSLRREDGVAWKTTGALSRTCCLRVMAWRGRGRARSLEQHMSTTSHTFFLLSRASISVSIDAELAHVPALELPSHKSHPAVHNEDAHELAHQISARLEVCRDDVVYMDWDVLTTKK